MFGRIKDSIRILSYKEVVIHPDLEISKDSYANVTRSGQIIAGLITGAVAILVGSVCSRGLEEIIPKGHQGVSHEVASPIITAGFSVFAFWIFEHFKNGVFQRLNLPQHLQPYFGHRIENTLRIIKAKSV